MGRMRREWFSEYPEECVAQLKRIYERFIRWRYRFGMLLLPASEPGQRSRDDESNSADIAWALRMCSQRHSPFSATVNDRAARYPGLDWGSIVAVCGADGLFAQDMSPLKMHVVLGSDKQSSVGRTDVG